MSSPREIDLETRRVNDVLVTIVELQWPTGGVSYDVYRDEDCLTEEGSFDAIPTDDEIAELLDGDGTPADAIPADALVLTFTVAIDTDARLDADDYWQMLAEVLRNQEGVINVT